MLRKKLIAALFLLPAINAFSQQQEPVPTPHWRPQYHFTPLKNWTNDPNGLFVLNGEFQLYYQHNPFENKWGHMSWGHATSKDLVNWKHHPVAIPEIVTKDSTYWIYSGSAVVDKNNTSGFGKNGKAPIVAMFTIDLPKQHKEVQAIAYSNDGGMSFTQYSGNPVLDLNKRDFRDPAVFWYEPAKSWVMTVAMVDEKQVRIYGSKNLKEWTKLSDFGPAGYTRHGWECPSLIPLQVDNDPSKTKWVMFVSSGGDRGPLMQYYIGDFDGTTFTNNAPASTVSTLNYGDAYYAAIAWRDAPQNKKILLGWLQDGKMQTYPWKGQMSIPQDLALKTTSEGVVLTQAPSSVVAKNLNKLATGKVLTKKNIALNETGIDLAKEAALSGNAYWIDAEFTIDQAKKIGFYALGKGSQKVVVGYDTAKQELFVDRTNSGTTPKIEYLTAPLKAANGTVKIQLLVDNSSLEVFGNDGERVISTMIYPDADAKGLVAFADGVGMLKSLKLWNLNK